MILFSYIKIQILELLRQPTYLVSTLALPLLFYIVFAIPVSLDFNSSLMMISSFSAFAVFGVVFFQFGVTHSQNRLQPWAIFLNSMPISSMVPLIARILTASFFGIFAATLILIVGTFYTPIEWTFKIVVSFYSILIIGGLLFSTMGLALGYWVKPNNSMPVANLIYFLMSYLGGLWMPPELLPKFANQIGQYLPTRHYGKIIWSLTNLNFANLKNHFIYLFLFFILFGMIALLGINRPSNIKTQMR